MIKGLFDKIVIDQSTVKAFNNDYAKRFACLLRDSESEMIFENYIMSTIRDGIQEDFKFDHSSYWFAVNPLALDNMTTANYIAYNDSHSKEEIDKDRKDFLIKSNLSEFDEESFKYSFAIPHLGSFAPLAAACFKEHLNSIYHSVEEHETKYPYRTNWGGVDHYFVVRDPKILINSANNFDVDAFCGCTLF